MKKWWKLTKTRGSIHRLIPTNLSTNDGKGFLPAVHFLIAPNKRCYSDLKSVNDILPITRGIFGKNVYESRRIFEKLLALITWKGKGTGRERERKSKREGKHGVFQGRLNRDEDAIACFSLKNRSRQWLRIARWMNNNLPDSR